MIRISGKIIPPIFCLIVLIILLLIIVFYSILYMNYDKVEAKIVSISSETYNGVGDSQSSRAYYIKYEYKYNGETYQVEQQVLTIKGKHEGQLVTLRCNPNKPDAIANNSIIIFSVIGSIFLLLLLLVSWKATRKV